MKSTLEKITVVSNLIYPLRVPLFNYLSQNKDYNFIFIFLRKTLGNRRWNIEREDIKFKYLVSPSVEIPIKGKDYFALIFNPLILFDLIKTKADVFISIGWAYPANWLVFIFARLTGRKFILWNESTLNEDSWRRNLSRWLIELIVKYSDAFLSSGIKAKEYLVSLGADANKVTVLGNAIDNELYKRECKSFLGKSALKKNLKITTDDFVVTYIGRFERVKGLDLLLEAFQASVQANTKLKLLLIGYGPLKEELEGKIKDLELEGKITLLGPFEREELIKYYSISDLVILPSYSETWGYVVNEALASSVPVVASSAVGSAIDLIQNGKNGFIFRKGDKKALSDTILKVSRDKYLQKELRSNCYKMVSKFNYFHMAQQVSNLLKKVNNE